MLPSGGFNDILPRTIYICHTCTSGGKGGTNGTYYDGRGVTSYVASVGMLCHFGYAVTPVLVSQ